MESEIISLNFEISSKVAFDFPNGKTLKLCFEVLKNIMSNVNY